MTIYSKRSIAYVAVVVVATGLILLFRSDMVREGFDWRIAVHEGTARAYRNYCAKWRTSARASEALLSWESALKREYAQLDWCSPHAVEVFIKDHPEFQEADIRRVQYNAVMKDGSYNVLKDYLLTLQNMDSRRGEVEGRIDSVVNEEVERAMKNNDYQELGRLSKKYADWKGWREWIEERIPLARENSAKAEWVQLSHSKSEQDLRRYMKRYSGTVYAVQASKRISELYDDFDFVKSKGSFKACLEFADSHPNSPRVDEAWQYVDDELASYVFGRKKLGADAALVKSTLARYKEDRPYSGALYGTDGYYTSPLQINTPTYGSDDYFVKLVNKNTGSSVGIYVRNGSTVEVAIPDGTYSVRYATGSQWHGTRFLFGFEAHYSRANGDFTFSNGRGYTLTLKKVAYGNLHTSPMSANDF